MTLNFIFSVVLDDKWEQMFTIDANCDENIDKLV